jgi:NAD(P)-dependent dehydrogenase (short-subunit alcohol dehydrogenase family)
MTEATTAMELYIVTGASRGLGRAIVEQLLGREHVLLTISRKPDRALDAAAAAKGAKLEQWALDLAHDVGAAARLEAWLHAQPRDRFAAATLINNAGLLGKVGPIDATDADTLAAVLRVGLEAPLVLTSAFLRATRASTAQRRVLNVSSGAGRRPIAGWAAYCAAKAGLDHFSRVTALDEQRLPNPARIVSLAPGVVDTDMQGELRASDPSGFPDIEQFRQLKASGQLATPEAAAARVLAYLARVDFGINPVADVRD